MADLASLAFPKAVPQDIDPGTTEVSGFPKVMAELWCDLLARIDCAAIYLATVIVTV